MYVKVIVSPCLSTVVHLSPLGLVVGIGSPVWSHMGLHYQCVIFLSFLLFLICFPLLPLDILYRELDSG